MRCFKVEITEVLQKTVSVQAENEAEAIKKVKASYRSEEIVLSENEFIGTKFDVVE